MAKRKTSPFQQQAADLSLIKYGPEVSALTALIRQAATDRDTRIASAKSGAQLIRSDIDAARPTINSIYDTAGQQASAAQAVAAPQIAALPAGSPFAAAAALEQSGLASRLAGARAGALTDLSQQRIDAGRGAVGEQQAALRTFGQSRGQIAQRAQDLAQEEGAFTASTIQQLLGADAAASATAANQAANRANSRGNALIGAGIDPDTGQPLPGHGSTKKWATPTQQAAASDTLQQAVSELKSLRKDSPDVSRQQAATLLLQGADDIADKDVPVYDTTTGKPKLNPDGTPVTKTIPGVKGVKQITSQLLVSAALDLAYNGYLSKRVQDRLHARGVKVADLGVRTYGDYQRSVQRGRRNSRGRTTPLAPGYRGQNRPT